LRTLESLNFNNRFAQLGGEFYQSKPPDPVGAPYRISSVPEIAEQIGLDPEEFHRPEWIEYFSGNRSLPGALPLAMAYSGFQFGSYNPQLGDGRGLLLGEIDSEDGGKWDLYLKGCGPTRYCRGFDGRATLKSSIREYLAGEALAGLGVPTTRALTLVGIGELIYRQHPEPAAVLTRVAKTHIRFGNFDLFHYTNRPDQVKNLADHVISVHFNEWAGSPEQYRLLFREVIDRTAYLIATWQSVGFAHGVMNTDNMSILGETFDFGPYGFMDRFNPEFIPNHSDTHGRYAYGRQPEIGYWNLAKLGETLGGLIPSETLQEELEKYKVRFNQYHSHLMAKKLGLTLLDAEMEHLLNRMYNLLFEHRPDYTNFFRKLAAYFDGNKEELRLDFHANPRALEDWLNQYSQLQEREDISGKEIVSRLRANNPKFILRNYLAQRAIDRALKDSDFAEIERLRVVLRHPFENQPDLFKQWNIDPEEYATDTPEPYLGMQVSCSA